MNRIALEKGPFWAWLPALFAVLLAVHGFGQSDLPDFLRMAPNMTVGAQPVSRQFLYSSPVNFMLGDFLGIPTVFGFYLIHIAECLGMLVVIPLCLRKKWPDNREAHISFLKLLSLTPLWLIVLKWIGKTDPLLISLMFVCWAYPGRWRWLIAALMVVVHREMGGFVCFFLFLSEEKKDYSLIVSLLLGFGFHYVYEHAVLNMVPLSRATDLTRDVWMHPKEVLERPVLYLLASLSWYWLVILWQRPAPRLQLGLLLAFILAGISEDFTRDFIMLALFPILYHLETVVRTPDSRALSRFFPLFIVQIQIAAMGTVFKPGNLWVDWLTGHLGDQLTR